MKIQISRMDMDAVVENDVQSERRKFFRGMLHKTYRRLYNETDSCTFHHASREVHLYTQSADIDIFLTTSFEDNIVSVIVGYGFENNKIRNI
uniref:NTP_transf_2 domain-containing protein n=1 Tax=Heterorhabditis bacteriophora TaxID=37862 RepID=A0A1I7W9W3_HETBA